ncbi:hypothetical protein [Allokutzneria multivorans]|uniref:hypothetical protein n=1 Tax=Allokutzneria multivorans TaxID=1142134 RepID=UPI0031EC906E
MNEDHFGEDRVIHAIELLDRDSARMRVVGDKCGTCILRPGNPAMLRAGRLSELLEQAAETFVPCHKTLDPRRRVQPAVCRGFFDAHQDRSPVLKALSSFGVLFVDAHELEKEITALALR